MPKLGAVMQQGTILQWRKKEGEPVRQGEDLLELETEKVTATYQAPAAGTVLKLLASEGQTVSVGEPICVVGEPGESFPPDLTAATAQPSRAEGPTLQPSTPSPPAALANVSPAARRLAESRGVDLSRVVGTGPEGTIMREDVLKTIKNLRLERPALTPSRVVPLTGLRAAIAARLSKSQRETAHVTLTREEDVSAVVALLHALGSEGSISYTDVFVKVAGKALAQHPLLNSWLEGDEVKVFERVNVDVAVAVEGGLLAPTVPDVNGLSLREVADRAKELAERARHRELSVDEVGSGTFTVTNLGMFGVEAFTPIINPPQTAILGIGRVMEKPRVVGGQIKSTPVVCLSLTFDHRVVDGADAARFLDTFVHLLSDLSWLQS